MANAVADVELSEEARVAEIKAVMGHLSMVHQDVLGYVIFHLRKVAEKESKNLVSDTFRGVVWVSWGLCGLGLMGWVVDVDEESGGRVCADIDVA